MEQAKLHAGSARGLRHEVVSCHLSMRQRNLKGSELPRLYHLHTPKKNKI